MQTNQTDRLALIYFRHSVDEDPLRALSSWNDYFHHPSRKSHVPQPDVKRLGGGGGGLLSPHVGNLSFLRSLVLQNNSFRGEIPQSIGHLFHLRHLVLSNNTLDGQMPTNLSQCSNLEILNLIDNQLVGKIPDELGSLSKLQDLGLAINSLAGSIPHSIGNLSQLYELSLMKNGNLFTGVIPSSLSNASGLQYIFYDNNNFHGPMPANLGRLKALRVMSLTSNELRDDFSFITPLTNCSRLEVISLDNNFLEGLLPDSIGNLSNSISLISMSSNTMYGTIPPGIGNLFNLSYLDLSNNSLDGHVPSCIGALHNLHELYLSGNMLTGEIPSLIGNLTLLNRFYLLFNDFYGEIPQSLGTLRGLQELDVSHNNFSGEIPSFLTQLTDLKYLNLSQTSLKEKFRSKNRNLCGGIAELNLPSCKLNTSKSLWTNKVRVITIVVTVLSCFILCLCPFIFWYRRKKLKKNTSSIELPFEHKFSLVSYKELFRALNGFSEINGIGKGRYGTIYKATTQEYGLVAVKVLNLGHRGASKSFVSECQTLGAIRHQNLVKIVNVCSSVDYHGNDFKALLYEYMANGSLENWIHQGNEGDVEHEHEHGKPRHLGLMQRLDIAIDITFAIKYLHEACSAKIVHGDLKPSNILLDNEMMGRVGDFGLATISSPAKIDAMDIDDSNSSVVVRGTIGYVPPKYGMGDMVSTQGDMYSYGILLLEMLTGRRPIEKTFKDHLNLHNFVKVALPD
ncbi:hypothetical protein EUGRSUZ_C01824 [Eucalyptus grandis]|uniref:Protein kinase domain-containing protein n=2 Tax=Eucalyptus grandis TaxID=71139 RepID=A0A059CQP4_EUCGR|nr:hypothetical protein EUGRSUZ_C01824 [Eucalyptus grandis]